MGSVASCNRVASRERGTDHTRACECLAVPANEWPKLKAVQHSGYHGPKSDWAASPLVYVVRVA